MNSRLRAARAPFALALLLAAMLLGGCGAAEPRSPATMPPFLTGTAEGTRYTYNCPKGAPFDVIAYEASAHRVTVVLPEQTLEMKQEASASQVRFVNGDYLFLAVGVTGMVHRGNEMLYGVCSLKL